VLEFIREIDNYMKSVQLDRVIAWSREYAFSITRVIAWSREYAF
jgi:hypothetical protein